MTPATDGCRAFRLLPDVVVETFADETIAVNLAAGRYYSLDPIGGEALALLTSGRSWGAVLARLAARHEGGEHTIAAALEDFTQRLVAEGLVELAEAGTTAADPDPGPGSDAAPSGAPFAPTMTVFSDMQDLLPLDPIHDVDASGWPTRAQGA